MHPLYEFTNNTNTCLNKLELSSTSTVLVRNLNGWNIVILIKLERTEWDWIDRRNLFQRSKHWGDPCFPYFLFWDGLF